MRKKIQLKYKPFFIFVICAVIISLLIPVIFTFNEMGYFRSEPKIETLSTVTSPDAPVLYVAADYDFAPRSFYDSNKNFSGCDIEIANEIANRLGYKISFTFGDWPTCKKMLQQGNVDLILGLEVFSNMQGVLKTIPISQDKLTVFGKSEIYEAGSLAGKRVGLVANSVITSLFDLNCEFVEYFTNTAILKAIEDGEIDYGISHESISLNIINKEGLHLVPSIVLMESFPAIGVRADEPELRNKINVILKEMSDDGFINKMENKWIIDYFQIKSIKAVFANNEKFFVLYLISFIIFLSLLIITLLNLRAQEERRRQYDLIASVADIYMSMHYLNLKRKTFTVLSQTSNIKKILEEEVDFMGKMTHSMKQTVTPEYLERALSFTDLTTISERMKNKKFISADFLGMNVGWFRAQFIAVDRNYRGDVETVIFTTQNIDEEKKRMEQLIHLSNIDELTGLFNRHAYKVDCDGENSIPDDFVYASFDVNGLKTMNDTKGHAAGDELLKATASCLFDVIHPFGKVYRVGGDEMVSILHIEKKQFEEMLKVIDVRLSSWYGLYVNGISVSKGVVYASEFTEDKTRDLEHIAHLADERMYEDKRSYYRSKGITKNH